MDLIKNKSIAQLFDETCKNKGLQEALVFPKENLQQTFTSLRIEVDKLAAGFLLAGLKAGDHVMLWGANHANMIQSIYACAKAGLVFSTVNPASPKAALVNALKIGDFRAIICFPSLKSGSSFQILTEICPELKSSARGHLSSKTLPKLTHIIMAEEEHKYCGTYTLSEIFGMGKQEHVKKLNALPYADPNQLASIQFTMGTTGDPKAVMLSHFQLLNACYVVGKRLYFDQDGEVLCCPMPVFRGPVMCLAVLATAVFGIKVVYPSPMPLPPAIFASVQNYKCTILLSNPIAFHLMLRLPNLKNFDIQSLTSVCLVGEQLPAELISAMQANTNIKDVTTGLFVTELGCMPIFSPTDGKPEKLMKCQGKPDDHFEVKMVDFNGEELKSGEIGQILIKPINGTEFLGYYNEKKRTENLYQDGWLIIGDVGTVDSDGYITIVGQKQDVILDKNEPIYPWNLEKRLSTHPNVLAVQVVAVPDTKTCQICACTVIKDKGNGEIDDDLIRQEMIELCKEEKTPEPNYIVYVKDFPRTPTKKVQKFKLKEMVPALIKEQYN